ncbi:MAG: ATP-binding protein [Clostridia bacterium]|nr:ATP-binding protein [Clostridia bacterium]
MPKQSSSLSFRVSAGLKNIIGRDLISDRYIAIFELVKNSYDAGASKVNITFSKTEEGQAQIIISDNGCGMTYNDIINKWLFVAYSEKKIQNRLKYSFRDEIRREVAGAKGVGRFSCDRLGEMLTLITKTEYELSANKVEVNWNSFETDDTQEFINIPVQYSTIDSLPSGFSRGTTLIVNGLRESWSREELLKLKRSLMKLISPDANKGEIPFDIELFVSSEEYNDKKILEKSGINPDRDIVNGIIHNDIFEKLNIKTTSIEVSISEDGQFITSKLTDRGDYIFSVTERNRNYFELRDIAIIVFYLNKSAKSSFTRQMGGVQPKNYGSVFIYKNGFRINPYGEPGRDFFGIDQRKAQGWKRYLGTREIMGRISIKGDNDQFIETTSRAHGFIQTPAVEMLSDFFLEKVLKLLEKYVVNLINWGEPLPSDPKHIISPNEISEQIVSQFITIDSSKDIVSVDYNSEILNPNSRDNTDNLATSLKQLDSVAELTQDSNLHTLAQTLKKRTESIISQNVQLEEENRKKEKELDRAQKEKTIRDHQIYFLKGQKNQNVANLVNGFHSIYTLTDATRGNISYLRDLLSKVDINNKNIILSIIIQIQQANEKAHKLADLAIHGNQSLKQSGVNSLYDFIRQYIDEGFLVEGLSYELIENEHSFNCRFDPSSIGVIIDNIASNSIKAGATKLEIVLSESSKYVEVIFSDNGIGLDENINPESLFEWGVSSNRHNKGFGIGLYHIKQLVTEMNGTVAIDEKYHSGFRLIMRIKK